MHEKCAAAARKKAFFGGAIFLLVSTFAHGAEEWEQLLRLQLEESKRCTMSGTVFVRQMPVSEGIVISGRAKCIDGREFDFSQDKPHMKFELKVCEPAVC